MAKPRKEPSTNAAKKLLAEKLAWVLVLLVAAGLFRALTLIPADVDPRPTFHVASRYLQQGSQETGTRSLSLAIWTDYRSFDLILLAFLLLTAALAAYTLFLEEKTRPSGVLSLSLAGTLALLSIGFYCVRHGSNFLDYEPFVSFFAPGVARHNTAWLAGSCLGLVLVGSLIAFLKVFTAWKGGDRDE